MREARQGLCIVCAPADWFQSQISIACEIEIILAGDTRIELVLAESKSDVLPLHQSPTEKRGGGGRDQTDDLWFAKPALSQLSYTPRLLYMARPERFKLPTVRVEAGCSIH